MGTIILTACISAIVGVGVYVLITNLVLKQSIKKRCEAAVKEAEAEGEMIKKEKILQAKEKFIQLKSEHDREVNLRNQKIAQSEQRAKQIESNLQNQQRDLENKIKENDRLKEQMQGQMQRLQGKEEEVERLRLEQNSRLEQISGMSSEEAKNILVENMKAEAKSDAAAYINETIEEAKLTATKEAKRIIVASIQRVATETAIENAVTVFHIDSDEVKGRIIGREGRNIRALEAATGIEIIVDDTPEAIILSGFDPVRREIARLALHQLVTDGRIHPARIEEVVAKVKKQIEEEIVHAIEAHHNDVEPRTVIACLVQAADAISAARPGARRENLENYIKRLEMLEEITSSFNGVDKSFAIQAGREVRIMVKPEIISEDQMVLLARDIAKKIEDELEYPGQIKVHLLRETKAIEYAK